MTFDLSHTLSGLLVGLLVGFTGVGGGSLMAPIMILVLGVAPVTAVGTDLWFAGITKLIGGAIHHAHGNADLRIVKWLCIGSIPLAAATLLVLSVAHGDQIKQGFISQALGSVIILTAIATLCRKSLHRYGERLRRNREDRFKKFQVPLTVSAGALLGILVTLTSVGAGALCATILIFLYPLRLHMRKVVGTDILHAIPLTFVAGIGHLWLGNVDANLLVSLLSGSIPGIVIGSNLVHKVNERIIQMALASVLILVGVRLVFS
jgi:uncharacterized membrane protein YfcA